jgi:two-component system, LuxR family, response regulator FixJ
MSSIQTIHVIDDDAVIRDSLHMLLEAEGYVVQKHESAEAFLNTTEEGDVGCIVTDVNMPGMTGIELLFEMCKIHIGMPAIVISGFMDARLSQATQKQGAFRCFQKPVDLDALLSAIHAALIHAYREDQNPAFSR